MSLSSPQRMRLRRYVTRLIVLAGLAFIAFKGYQEFQRMKQTAAENRARNEAYERDNIATEAEKAIIKALPEERKKGRVFVKTDGQMFSFPSRYYYNLGMWLEWVKDGEFSGHLETDPKRQGDEHMWITVHPKGSFPTTRQKFDDLFKQGVLTERTSPRKGIKVYRKPGENKWDIEDYYVLTDFKDFEGKPPVIQCGPWSAGTSDGYCITGFQTQPNVLLSIGDLTAKYTSNLPEIYQVIINVANQIEEIK